MRQKRLSRLLKELNMSISEFAEESGIYVEDLKKYDQIPDAHTTKAIVQYFTGKDNSREKLIIKDWLIHVSRKYLIEDKEIFMILGDYLSYQSQSYKYTFSNGYKRLQHEIYSAYNIIFEGKEQVVQALNVFLSKAAALKDYHSAVIVQNSGKLKAYGLWEPYNLMLQDCRLPITRSDADSLPVNYHQNKILVGILPNHFCIELMGEDSLCAVITNDAIAVNGEYLRYQDAASGMCVKQKSKGAFNFRLAYIMNLTQMSNEEISNMMFVDKTLISKWRNGKRKLRCHDDMLCKFTMELYHANDRNKDIIHTIVSSYFKLAPSCDVPDILLYFRKWLTYQEEDEQDVILQKPDSFRYIRYLTYMGKQGLRDAVKTLFHYAGQAACTFRMFVTCYESMEWLYSLDGLLLGYLSDSEQSGMDLFITNDFALGELLDYLFRNTEKGSFGKIIFNLILSGNINLHLFHSTKLSKKKIIFAIPEVAVLTASREVGIPDEMFVQGYYDQNFVNEFFKSDALPMESTNISLSETYQNDMEMLIINDIGILGLLEKDDLIHIYKLSTSEADLILSKYKPVFIQTDHSVKLLISGNDIEEAIKCGTFLYKPLSIILQREIYISGHIMKTYIKKLMRLMKEEQNYNIQILMGKYIDVFGNCIIGKNESILWNSTGLRVFKDMQMMKLIKRIFYEKNIPFFEGEKSRDFNINLLMNYLDL